MLALRWASMSSRSPTTTVPTQQRHWPVQRKMAIRELMTPTEPPKKRKIGFVQDD